MAPSPCFSFADRLFGGFGRRAWTTGALLGRILGRFGIIVGAGDRGRQDCQIETLIAFFNNDLARATATGAGRFSLGSVRRGGGGRLRFGARTNLRFGLGRGLLRVDRRIADRTFYAHFLLRRVAIRHEAVATGTVAAVVVARATAITIIALIIARLARFTAFFLTLTLALTIGAIARGTIILTLIALALVALALIAGRAIILALFALALIARGTIILALVARRAVILRLRVGAEIVIAVEAGVEIVTILVEIAFFTGAVALLLLLLTGTVVGEYAEIMIGKLQIIFGIDPVARHLGIARHILVFLKKLGRVAACAVVDAVTVVATAPIVAVGTSVVIIVPAAIAATGLPVVDQDMILAFAMTKFTENTVQSPSPSTACSSGRIRLRQA
jgi:hypothetical protein